MNDDAMPVDVMPEELPESLPVTDAHLHLWELGASPYAWLEGAPAALRHSGRWSEAGPALAGLGVRRVILVQADDTAADTAHLQRTAERIEQDASAVARADVVGWLPLADPDRAARDLADPDRMRRLVGVRHLVHDDPDPGFLERPEVAESLDRLAAAGFALDVPDAYPRHLAQTVRVAARHPRLRIVLDHLGKPPLGDAAGMREWRAQLADLASHPLAVAKISGLATSGDGRFAPAVQAALELLGPDRLLVGSDWPIAPRPFGVETSFAPLLAHLRGLGLERADLARILTGTAQRVYRRLGEELPEHVS